MSTPNNNVFRTNGYANVDEAFTSTSGGLRNNPGTMYDIRMMSSLQGPHIDGVLAIDSKHRNKAKYPNPNAYKIDLKTVYKDVAQIELKLALIPNSSYHLNRTNNVFYFQDTKEQLETGANYQIALPVGDWPAENDEGPSIQSILESELNEASQGSSYSVRFCKYTRKFTLKQLDGGSGIFNISFCGGTRKVGQHGTITRKICGVDDFLSEEVPVGDYQKTYLPCSIGKVLGFDPKNLEGRLEYTSQGVVHLNSDRYIILRIPGLERIDSNGDAQQGAFAIIGAVNAAANSFILTGRDIDLINTETYTKYFNPPLPELSQLRLEFYNCDGEPFDFNGIDHILIFDVRSLTQQKRY